MLLDTPRVVFVRGGARTGTTLLADIMNEHPEIAIFVEQPLGDLAERMRDVFWFAKHRESERKTMAAYADAPPKERKGSEHFTPIENVERMQFPLRYPTEARFGEIVAAVVRASMDKPNAQIVGSKTPGHWDAYELAIVQRLFSDIRYVFVVRNPFDTVNSIINRRNLARRGRDMWPDKPVEEAISRYQEAICLLLSCSQRFAHQCYVVAYEDLVARPAETLAGVGTFLDADVSDRSGLITQSRPARTVLTRHEERSVREAFAGAIDAWSAKRLTGPLANVGHQLDDCVRTFKPGTRYKSDWPVGDRGFLGTGWSGAEPRGIWSDAPEADVFFRVPRDGHYALALDVAGYVPLRKQPLEFGITIGDTTVNETLAHARNTRLRIGPVSLDGARAHRLTFSFGVRPSERELGKGDDRRRKALCLRRIQLLKA